MDVTERRISYVTIIVSFFFLSFPPYRRISEERTGHFDFKSLGLRDEEKWKTIFQLNLITPRDNSAGTIQSRFRILRVNINFPQGTKHLPFHLARAWNARHGNDKCIFR